MGKKNDVLVTYLFVGVLVVGALVFLFLSKSLDLEYTDAKYTAESICFIDGHLDGVSEFVANNHSYAFVCDTSNSTKLVYYWKGVGWLKYQDTN